MKKTSLIYLMMVLSPPSMPVESVGLDRHAAITGGKTVNGEFVSYPGVAVKVRQGITGNLEVNQETAMTTEHTAPII